MQTDQNKNLRQILESKFEEYKLWLENEREKVSKLNIDKEKRENYIIVYDQAIEDLKLIHTELDIKKDGFNSTMFSYSKRFFKTYIWSESRFSKTPR